MPQALNVYEDALQQGRLWTPRVFAPSDVWLWLDPSDLKYVTFSSGAPTGLSDVMGSSRSAGQTGSPSYQYGSTSSVLCRRNTLSLSGSGQYFFYSSGSGYNATNGLSGFCVAKGEAVSTYALIGATQNPSDGAPELRWAGNTLQLLRAKQVGLVTGGNSPVSGMNVAGFIAYSNFSGAYLNGVANENSTNPAFTQGVSAICTNGDIERFAGLFGESIVLVRKINALERAQLEGYLAWKWGCQDALVASHLYKWRPPLLGA